MINLVNMFTKLTKLVSPSVDKKNYIFYRIIEKLKNEEKFLLHCVNTSAIFYASMDEIMADVDILYGLHPIQACYIGIEYAFFIKKINVCNSRSFDKISLEKYKSCRYGDLIIISQDRFSNVRFIDRQTDFEFSMDALDLALSNFIERFDAIHAFYIGVLAGSNMNKAKKIKVKSQRLSSFLKLIK